MELVKRHSFGLLVSAHQDEVQATHLPFLIDVEEDGAIRLTCHLARANPHSDLLLANPRSLAIFTGPHAYISPSLYATHPSVPTWNYAAVHLYGNAQVMDAQSAADSVIRMSNHFEQGREYPWSPADLTSEYVSRMVNGLCAFSIVVDRLEAKSKLSQNRSMEDRGTVMRSLAASDNATENELAAMMLQTLPREEL